MIRSQLFRVAVLMSALAAAASAFAADVIPNPLEIPLDPVGERLTPAQEKLIEGAWCRKLVRTAENGWTYLPPSINQEQRFRKLKGSVFNTYEFTEGGTARRGNEAIHSPTTSKTSKTQITIDKDSLFVVAQYRDFVYDPNGSPQHQFKSIVYSWFRVRVSEMQLVYSEYYTATWKFSSPGVMDPWLIHSPKSEVKSGALDNPPWTRCEN